MAMARAWKARERKLSWVRVPPPPLTPRRSFEEAKAVILFPQFFRMKLGFVGEVSVR